MMEFFNPLHQIIAFTIMTIIIQVQNVADWIMWNIDDYEVYDNIFKLLLFCAGNFYFWQSVAAIGFYYCLRRLADIFPSPIIETDVGPSIVQLLEEKKASLKDAKTALKDKTAKNEELHKANAGLQAKVDRLQKELEFTSNDRYELVRKTWVLQNRLGDFESWPQFREEFDRLTTQYSAMQRQRAREEISREQILHVAKEAKRQLEVAKRAEAMREIAHSSELELVKRERDEARENYETLLSTTTAATTPIIATTTAAGVSTLVDKALQEENTRLTLALRSKTTLLAKKTSEFERIQSLIKTRSEHSASQLKAASATILTLDEDRKKASKRIAVLEKEVQVANDKAEKMEEMYMAVAFADEAEEKEDDTKEGDDEGDMDGEQTSWLLRRVVAMSKKHRSGGGSSENTDDNEDNDEEDDGNDEDDDDEGDGANEKNDDIRGEDNDSEKERAGENKDGEKNIHDENEDLFNDMMGNP